MTYGVDIRNGNNETVVDGVHDNYMLWFTQTVSHTFTPQYQYNGGYGGDYIAIMPPCFSAFPEKVTTQEPPIVCGYAESGDAVFGYCTGEQYAWDGFVWFAGWSVGVNHPNVNSAPTVSASLRVAVFSRHGSPQKRGSYGLQISNNGAVVYDSRALPFIPTGPREYKRYGTYDGRTMPHAEGYYATYLPSAAACVVDTQVVPGGWPLLSSLTQRIIPGLAEGEWAGFFAAPIMAISVTKSGDSFTYKFVSIAVGVHSFGRESSGNLWYGWATDGLQQNQLYNTGGGQGAYNLIAFAKIPAAFQ